MSPLVIASHNEGKVREIRALLANTGITVISAGALNLPEPEETGSTFAENAILKSSHASMLSGHSALADDSGLCVQALGGAPGIYSARWAGKNKDFTPAMQRIHEELGAKGVPADGQKAWFICVLSLTTAEGVTHTFEGRVDGTLVFPPRGNKGFGYDPLFVPEGGSETFGEMEPDAKHAISHRARAFKKLTAHLTAHAQGGAL